jgi:hypothetical protein
MLRSNVKAVLLLFCLTIVYYWKIVLTTQFSFLTTYEGVNQAYSWMNFLIVSVKAGRLPLWDPFWGAGRSFAGEMQTAAFYPLNLLLALAPLNREGMLSPHLYECWLVFAHFLGAAFMYALIRQLGLNRFAAVVAGICFAFPGGKIPPEWPHLFQSSIWLPLILVFLLRAIRVPRTGEAVINASVGGVFLGLAILAGGLHIVIMEMLIIASAAVFVGFHPELQASACRAKPWGRPALTAAVLLVAGCCGGSVQLLPSMEYSAQALRFLGSAPAQLATNKIPYAYLSGDGLLPQGIVGLLVPFAFNGSLGRGEALSPYFGIFPLIAAAIGIWKCWGNPWVRYLTGLAAAAILYSLGSFSILHGLLYAVVPYLWMAREAGRFMFLADFAFAILAAFGVETLLTKAAQRSEWNSLEWMVRRISIFLAMVLGVCALLGRLELGSWASLSILLFFCSYGLLRYIIQGHTGRSARILILALILFDLHAFDWGQRNKIEASKAGENEMDRIRSLQGAADFVKSRTGLYRAQVENYPGPDLGDLFAIQTLGGAGATQPADYAHFTGGVPHAVDIMNLRYFIKPASAPDAGPVYQDAAWKVYENPRAYERGWLVHDVVVEPSSEKLLRRLNEPGIDPHLMAFVEMPLHLEPMANGVQERVMIQSYQASEIRVSVHSGSRALLVLSEMFYPGWKATVNGSVVPIYKVDGALRGIVVSGGVSNILLSYAPRSVFIGALLSVAGLCAPLLTFALWRRKRSGDESAIPA